MCDRSTFLNSLSSSSLILFYINLYFLYCLLSLCVCFPPLFHEFLPLLCLSQYVLAISFHPPPSHFLPFFPSSLSSSLTPQGSDNWLDATWVFFGPYPRRWCRSRSGFRSTRGWACYAASWCEVYWPGRRGRKREQVAELIIPQCLTSFVWVTSGGSPRWSLSCRWNAARFLQTSGRKKKKKRTKPPSLVKICRYIDVRGRAQAKK